MADAPITNAYRVDDYACFQLLVNIDLNDNQEITVADVGAGWDGDYLVVSQSQWQLTGVDDQGELQFSTVSQIPNQVIVYSPGANSTLHAVIPNGTLSYTLNVRWIDHTDVANWLGITYASDATFIDLCTDAANHFCYRRRQESGYLTDKPNKVPSEDVKLGTIMYAGAVYRARGSIDQFSSFSEMGTAPVVGLSPVIKQLLGNQRPQVA